MSAKYYALLTNIGVAKITNAAALGTKLNITEMAVGDGGGALPTPTPEQTTLVNERRRAPINQLSIDPLNDSQIIVEQVIPENIGGWWIREVGLFDVDGDLVAVSNCAETYKPLLQEGSGRTQTVRMVIIVSNTASVTVKIDPAVVLATREYVDKAIAEREKALGEGFLKPDGSTRVNHRLRSIFSRLDDEVSVLDFGRADKYGTAMEKAIDFVMSQGGGTIFVPGVSYTLDKTVTRTLTTDVHIRMSRAADVVMKTPMDLYNISSGDYLFTVDGGHTTVSFQSTDFLYAVFRLKGRTLRQSCRIASHTLRRTGTNNIGHLVYAEGCNSPELIDNHISAANTPFHLESSLENSVFGLVANAMEGEISGNKIYNAINCIDIVNKGHYGCEGLFITRNKFICSANALTITAGESLRASYMPPLVHFVNNHVNASRAIVAQTVSRVFVIGNDIQAKYAANDDVKGIFEFYSCQGVTLIGNKFSAVAQNGALKSDINTPLYFGIQDVSLKNAYIEISSNVIWLDGMTAPCIDYAGASIMSGRVKYNENILQSLGPISRREFNNLIDVSGTNRLSTYDASEAMAYASTGHQFDSATGILYLSPSPAYGDFYIVGSDVVPDKSTINQVVATGVYGRQLRVQFSAAEITLVHGINMICPDGKKTKMWLPTIVVFEFTNQLQSRVVSISGVAVRHVIDSVPVPGMGSVGDVYFDATNGRKYEFFGGSGWWYTTYTKV